MPQQINMLIAYIAVLVCLLAWTVAAQKLTIAAAALAGVLAIVIFWGTGLRGVALLGSFFLLGTSVTQWGKGQKIAAGFADAKSSRRKAGQVAANGGVAGLLGLLAILYPQQQALFLRMMAGAFSAAAADTCASELGVIYGKRFYNIRTLKKDRKGLDGVVSFEGALLGLTGSFVIALVDAMANNDFTNMLPIVVAGTAGNLADSWLGATLERRGVLGNDAVNTANTAIGAIVIWLWLWA